MLENGNTLWKAGEYLYNFVNAKASKTSDPVFKETPVEMNLSRSYKGKDTADETSPKIVEVINN